MPLIAFVDNELYEKIKKISGNKIEKVEEYPEYEFIASCLKVGLRTEDLKKLTYIEVMKILYSFLDKDEVKEEKNATQADIDKFLM